MCFHIDTSRKETKEKSRKRLFGKKDTIICYKIIVMSNTYGSREKTVNTKYMSEYRRAPIYLGKINESDRKHTSITPQEKRDKVICKGIHVYTNKKKALIYLQSYVRRNMVEVECKIEDFVAYNECMQEAVFTKVKYPNTIKSCRTRKTNNEAIGE